MSNAIVRLHAGNLGTGPTRARADWARDVLMVVLEDSLTPVERTLMARGRGEQVLALRREFQGAMREEYVHVVERITGRRVRVLMSEGTSSPTSRWSSPSSSRRRTGAVDARRRTHREEWLSSAASRQGMRPRWRYPRDRS